MKTLIIPLTRDRHRILRRLPRMLHGTLLPPGVPRPHWTATDVLNAFLSGKDEAGRLEAEGWAMNSHWSIGYLHARDFFLRQQERRRAGLSVRYTAQQLRTFVAKLDRAIARGRAHDRVEESRRRRENRLARERDRKLREVAREMRLETRRAERLRINGSRAEIAKVRRRLATAIRRYKRLRGEL